MTSTRPGSTWPSRWRPSSRCSPRPCTRPCSPRRCGRAVSPPRCATPPSSASASGWATTRRAHPLLRSDDDGRLSLSRDVAVDWTALVDAAQRSRNAVPREEREPARRALQLVRGGLQGRPHGRYTWLPRTRLESTVADVVVDAAHRLVQLCTDDQDPRGAAAAAGAGLVGGAGVAAAVARPDPRRARGRGPGRCGRGGRAGWPTCSPPAARTSRPRPTPSWTSSLPTRSAVAE